MGRLAGFSGRQVQRVAENNGWRVSNRVGSHIVMTHPSIRENLSIPDHREVHSGLLRALIRTMGISVEAFLRQADR
jgi:predicted RNA binding protein YcfA (HicA-like mRNA interferase family)